MSSWYYAKPTTENSIKTPYGWVSIPSPSERLFLKTWYSLCENDKSLHLETQKVIGKYRVDFAHLPTMTVIEIDGAEHYLDPEIIIKDRKRQSDIESWGWRVIRIGSWKVFRYARDCVSETQELILGYKPIPPKPRHAQQYKSGDRVGHRLFGEGIIIKSEMEQDTEFVEVLFQGKGRKRLSMDYAVLERLQEVGI